MASKECRRCHVVKAAADFNRCSRNSDGLQSYCRDCRKGICCDYYERNRETILAKASRYAESKADYYRRNAEELKRQARERYWANPERHREAARAYHAANAGRVREQRKEFRVANRDRLREIDRAYYAANKERFREYARENRDRIRVRMEDWRAANPDKVRQAHLNRRGRIHHPDAERIDPSDVLVRDRGLCGICGDPVDLFDFHIDHVVPLSRGGLHVMDNVQVAHPFCNLRKGARLPEEMAA